MQRDGMSLMYVPLHGALLGPAHLADGVGGIGP